MSYTKHNYKKGDELLASQLNEMDDQIELNEQTADILVTVSNTQPSQEKNRVWVKATPSEIEIPTMDDIDEVNRHLSDLEDTVSTTQIINTASGAIASFSDGADSMPIRKLVAQIEPVQDLHGYDSPWPAGGGMNLLFVDSKATGTLSGMTITSDDDFIYVNGTKYGSSQNLIASMPITLPSGTYYVRSFLLSGTYSTGSSFGISLSIDSTTPLTTDTMTSEKAFTLESETTFYVNVVSSDRNVISNVKVGVVISKTSGITQFSPYSNICPISGHTGMTVGRVGKNWLAKPFAYISDTSSTLADCFFVKAGSYLFSFLSSSATSWRFGIRMIDANGTLLSSQEYNPNANQMFWNTINNMWLTGANGSTKYITITIAKDCYIRIVFALGDTTASSTFTGVQLERGSTATTYEPYTGNQISVNWEDEAGTVYGGTVDVVTGKLVNERNKIIFDGSSSSDWNRSGNYGDVTRFNYVNRNIRPGSDSNALCNMFKCGAIGTANLECFNIHGSYGELQIQVKTSRLSEDSISGLMSFFASNNLEVCYDLVTTIEYQLTPQELDTLLGTNNIWSSTGDVTVDYPADTKLYIDGKLAEIQATILENIGG